MANNDQFTNNLLAPGTWVAHKDYGAGIIIKCTSDSIYVSFDGREKPLIFPFPASFKDGYMRFIDASIDLAAPENSDHPQITATNLSISSAFSTWLDKYFDHFPARWEKEKYLWKAVQTFRRYWDPDASDFSRMLSDATADADHLLNHTRFYPRAMIIDLAQKDPSYVRTMFESLFDESIEVSIRAIKFSDDAEHMRTQYSGKLYRERYQTMNSISAYLWLKQPENYYFYKYDVAKEVSRVIGLPYTSLRDSEVNKMMRQFALMDEISAVLRQDDRSRKLLEPRLDNSLYSDEQLHCMAMDFAFFIRPCYADSKK